jgi:hypothetical protein
MAHCAENDLESQAIAVKLLPYNSCMISQGRKGLFRNASNLNSISCAKLTLPPSLRACFKLLKS